jgi:fatty acid desaturase
MSTQAPQRADTAVDTPARGSDFARLAKEIKDSGLMRRRPLYYGARMALVAAAFAGGCLALVSVGDSWWTLVVAAFLALVFGQIALVTHDVGHRQVFRRTRSSALIGRLVGNLGIGMGYGWWQDKHSRHHANPNHEELDPDVAPDILVWTQAQAQAARGLPRRIGKAQAYLFFPLLSLEGFNLHFAGIRALADRSLKQRKLEGTLLAAHFLLYFGALFLLLSPGKAVVFVVVHQCLFGLYLGAIFAPNHKGMPTLTGGDRPDFLRRQVLTSRNVRGGWFTDVVLGGLNYQIEHHLFPSMPSPNLRKAQLLVHRYCDDLGVDYLQTSLITSYRQAIQSLHQASRPLRQPRSA